MREYKEKIELKKEWNKINYEERKKIIEIFERIAKEKEDEVIKRNKKIEENKLRYKMEKILKYAFNSYLNKNFNNIKVYEKKLLEEIVNFEKIIDFIDDKDIKKKFIEDINKGKNINDYLNSEEIIKKWIKQKNLPDFWYENSDEGEVIGSTGACVFREYKCYKDGRRILESLSSFKERVREEAQNQNPHN